MESPKRAYINVDQLLPQVSLEQAAQFYSVALPELRRIGAETRAKCFLTCGRAEETGDRALAIQTDSPTKIWKCHDYHCPLKAGGNLVGLCDLMKPGQSANGRPRGERFKAIAADLQAMVEGFLPSEPAVPPAMVKQPTEKKPDVNVPLDKSDNERARELVNLDQQFVTDPAAMPPDAAGYFRRRPFLSPEACARYRVGYLPRSAKSLLRGKIVYPYHSPTGEILTWFGRDASYETKHRLWEHSDRTEPEPVKTQFVKGFHRGLELWGEHVVRAQSWPHSSARIGVVVVEGPNDALNLQALGLPAVALCSNSITKEQVERIVALAEATSNGLATLLLDCDEEGQRGMQQVLPLLAERMHVRAPWSRASHRGQYQDRQPESLSTEELQQLLA